MYARRYKNIIIINWYNGTYNIYGVPAAINTYTYMDGAIYTHIYIYIHDVDLQ